jgi:hypothetical protein
MAGKFQPAFRLSEVWYRDHFVMFSSAITAPVLSGAINSGRLAAGDSLRVPHQDFVLAGIRRS